MVRSAQDDQGGFNPPPGFGLLPILIVLELDGLLGGFSDRLGPLGLVELAGVALDLGGIHLGLSSIWASPVGNACAMAEVPAGKGELASQERVTARRSDWCRWRCSRLEGSDPRPRS